MTARAISKNISTPQSLAPFAERLLEWFDTHGRHDLPWQHPRTPYRVWISEIMLQQTQVQTVIGYFERFLARFPDLPTLAAADEDAVLALWSGLGYYSRARNLHAAARQCVAEHASHLPRSMDALCALPGIGRSTAAAILTQAHGEPHAILDGNVKRVLARLMGEPAWPGQRAVEQRLWAEAEARLPKHRLADYTQALMDFGATLCTPRRPRCDECPLRDECGAFAQNAVGQIPGRKPAKATPTRSTCMLIARDSEGRVLLERRSGKGVWQGLWSLPEAEDAASIATLQTALGAGAGTPLPEFTHVFSHYRLRISPSLHCVNEAGEAYAPDNTAPTSAVDGPERRWIAPSDYDAIGLPRPVRTLLESLP